MVISAPPTLPRPAPPFAGLALRREISCIRALAWRTDLPIATDWVALGHALEGAGLVRRAPLGRLERFLAAAGDEVAILPASGRVQLRVHYTVPEHERRFAAERLFRLVIDALFHALRRS